MHAASYCSRWKQHCGSVHYITIWDSRLCTVASATGLRDTESIIFNRGRSVASLSRIGYFIPLNGPLNGHPPSTNLTSKNYPRGQQTTEHHSERSFLPTVRIQYTPGWQCAARHKQDTCRNIYSTQCKRTEFCPRNLEKWCREANRNEYWIAPHDTRGVATNRMERARKRHVADWIVCLYFKINLRRSRECFLPFSFGYLC